MTTWYSLEINNADEVKITMKRIMDAFMPKYIGAGRPLDLAIFSSHITGSNMWRLYFSPKALSLALRFGATPYNDDFVDVDLSLVVGDERSIDTLFPCADSQ